MMTDPLTIIYIELIAAGIAYAIFLNWKPVYNWYFPKWIVLAVIGGTGIVLAGVYQIEQVVALTTARVFFACLAVGFPIFIWQLWVNRERKQTREEVLKKRRT